ncbi:hypothetical protein [Burkholderia stabilis]|uniref:Uncharacterized protein n=1 Tax=Burkholderia stabilis TaxID=95485 RepID=A0A1Y1BEG9_9BURK|nr:hypothetical protein [Burkholderia stabilis]BAX58370.1 hypothetical protein BSFP_011840 [Burkholderia stabilis]
MADLWETPAARAWLDAAVLRHSNGVFGKISPAVIWSDVRGDDGELIVPVDPQTLVDRINSTPYALLHNHDPGRPKGRILESAQFESEGGRKFVAAVLGYYVGGDVLSFRGLGLDAEEAVSPPLLLPVLPDGIWMDFATDPREVEEEWATAVINDAPLRVSRVQLSHNSADSAHELIRVGVPFVLLVWNPLVTAIASEIGKGIYAAFKTWLQKLLDKLSERRNPILVIQSHQDDCEVSFILRGKDVGQHYAAHDAQPDAAAQAARLIAKLKARDTAARQLVYEFDKEASKWYPSYAVLNDDRIVTDKIELIAIENLPSNLSLGLSRGESNIAIIPAALDDGV